MVQISYTSSWDFLVRYMIGLPCVIVSIFLVGGAVDQVFEILPIVIDKSIIEWSTIIAGLFGGISLFHIIFSPELTILSSWLYLRFSLFTPASWADAERLSMLFTQTHNGKWYPLTEVKKLDKKDRLYAVYQVADKLGLMIKPKKEKLNFLNSNPFYRRAFLLVSVIIVSIGTINWLINSNFISSSEPWRNDPIVKKDNSSDWGVPVLAEEYSQLEVLPLPLNGQTTLYTTETLVAPLTIKTRNSGMHYFVKLTRSEDNVDMLSVFIKSGGLVNLEAPLGNFIIKYASGKTWFGEQDLFGPGTAFSKADKVFSFYESGNQISGYTVELIMQRHGNLKTMSLNENEW